MDGTPLLDNLVDYFSLILNSFVREMVKATHRFRTLCSSSGVRWSSAAFESKSFTEVSDDNTQVLEHTDVCGLIEEEAKMLLTHICHQLFQKSLELHFRCCCVQQKEQCCTSNHWKTDQGEMSGMYPNQATAPPGRRSQPPPPTTT
ncbi:unnamed protein product [Arctogadus glacialis]